MNSTQTEKQKRTAELRAQRDKFILLTFAENNSVTQTAVALRNEFPELAVTSKRVQEILTEHGVRCTSPAIESRRRIEERVTELERQVAALNDCIVKQRGGTI